MKLLNEHIASFFPTCNKFISGSQHLQLFLTTLLVSRWSMRRHFYEKKIAENLYFMVAVGDEPITLHINVSTRNASYDVLAYNTIKSYNNNNDLTGISKKSVFKHT